MTITLWIVAIVAVGILAGGPRLVAWRSCQLDEIAKLREQFFASARKLLDNDDTPEPVIRRLDTLAHNMVHASAIRGVFWAALTGDLRRMINDPPKELQEFFEAVKGMPQGLRDVLSQAVTASVLAASYESMIFGTLFRRLLLFAATRSNEQATYVAASMTPGGFGHGGTRATA